MSTIDLNCLVSGDDPDKIFTVEIEPDKNVSILKQMIKKKAQRDFSGVEATDIQLFKVSLSEAELKEQGGAPGKFDPTQELSSPLDGISDHFRDPASRLVHVIAVGRTGRGNHKQFRLPPELREDLETAWTQKYQGSTHRILLNNILSDPRALLYCNTGAIVQSSGYGKSRTVDELAKLVFTIPLNIRDEAETLQGAYPLPDTCIATSIQSMARTASDNDVVTKFHILFCSLFNRIVAELDTIHLASDLQPEYFAAQWREHLLRDDNRSKLYSSVVDDAQRQWSRTDLPPSAQSDARAALRKLIKRIPVVAGKPLSVVMYVDEAHELEVWNRGSTLYDLLIKAVSEYNSGFFVLFLSTVPRMRPLAPITKIPSSSRMLLVGELIPPYTEMPFDCHPTLVSSSLGELTLKDVQDFGFIARFGRPLFWSMLEAAQQSSGTRRDTRIKTLALQKLTFSTSISNLKPLAKLAILDTILNLEYHRFRAPTPSLMEEMVSSHMRTAYSAPKHQEYLHTGYPSEPVLADAAMEALYRAESESRWFSDAAAEFFDSLNAGPTKGTIDMGQRGENVARMILVRAYMSAVRADQSPSSSDFSWTPSSFDFSWSSGCPLVTFLKSLTGKDFQEVVLDCKPNNLPPSDGQPLKDAFEKSWVRFTHFGRAADDGAVTTSAACAAFVRAMSFIGCSSQNSVDVCIPILLDSDKPIVEANMSAILVQIKLRSKKGSYEIDAKNVGLFPPPGSSRDCTKMARMDVDPEEYFRRPYISLVMELGVGNLRDEQPADVQTHWDRTSVSTSNKLSPPRIGVVAHKPPTRVTPSATSESKADITRIHPRYSLCFYGCTPEVYGCISEEAQHRYRYLLQLSDVVLEHPRPSSFSAVLRMKPFWRTDNHSYDWFNDSWLRADKSEVQEDAAMEEEEGHVFEDERQNLGMVVD